jgi:hypothetical protein
MKKKIFLLGLLYISFFVGAQDSRHIIDRLKQGLRKGNPREQFKILNSLSDEFSNNNLEQSKYYSHKALYLAKTIKNDTFIALSYNNIGNIHQYKSELDSALFYHKKALKIRQLIKDSIGIADSYNNIGIIYGYPELNIAVIFSRNQSTYL